MVVNATLLPELGLLNSSGVRFIAGVDEVGRGALAGPVTVGVCVFDMHHESFRAVDPGTGVLEVLDGVRDSKLLTPKSRQRWAPVIREQAAACAVVHRSAQSIDALGITGALRRAGVEALNTVEKALGVTVDAVILDGSHDWLTSGSSSRVHCMVKADTLSASVAGASVIAKVERDFLMEELGEKHPEYGWSSNRGYGSQVHRQALQAHGATEYHRLSWNLGLSQEAFNFEISSTPH